MIQRIQTVFLAISAVLLVATLWVLPFKEWGLYSILILGAVVALASIFLYKNRPLQVRTTMFSTLLVVGYYIVLAVSCYASGGSEGIALSVILPLVALVLNLLAVRSIRKDEALVKAADRLR